jgi:hypothetical protein
MYARNVNEKARQSIAFRLAARQGFRRLASMSQYSPDDFKDLFFVAYSVGDQKYVVTPASTYLKNDLDLFMKKRAHDWLILSVHDSAENAKDRLVELEMRHS